MRDNSNASNSATHNMPKQFFKKLTQNSGSLRHSKLLGPLGSRIQDPNLWHLNRHSVSRAFFAAFFTSVTLMMFPCHTITVAFLAVWLRANLPISVSLVWLVNPFTIPPLAYAAIKIGLVVMPGAHTHDVRKIMHFDWAGDGTLSARVLDFWHIFERIWEPFMLGSFTLGLIIGTSCYFVIQGLWRWQVSHSWKNRHIKRRNKSAPSL
jgi:uncharacterized protein (DUF2062 family)